MLTFLLFSSYKLFFFKLENSLYWPETHEIKLFFDPNIIQIQFRDGLLN